MPTFFIKIIFLQIYYVPGPIRIFMNLCLPTELFVVFRFYNNLIPNVYKGKF